MTELEKAARMALEALNLAWAAHGKMLMSDPPQEAWKAWNVSTAIRESMIALRQALEQPAQQELEQDEHAPNCGSEEFMLRGILASELKCWHRLTGDEAQNLLDFMRNIPASFQEKSK